MNNQFGLRTATGSWLPRDAVRRNNGERFLQPDLWQDESRAAELALKYRCDIVAFAVTQQSKVSE